MQAMGRNWLSARRRKIFLLCAVLGLGGYGSYRIYRSVSRRRSLLGGLAQLIEAFTLGIESTSLVAGDVRSFLFSDDDDVPRSLKQGLKLMQCKEFQDALASFSASVSKGVITSVLDSGCPVERSPSSSRRKNSSRQGAGGLDDRRTGLDDRKTVLDDRKADLDERKAGGLEDSRKPGGLEVRRSGLDDKKNAPGGAAEVHIFVESRDHVVIGSGADQNDKHVLCEEVQASAVRAEGLPERVMQKLFTDAGQGFASAVLGSVAKNATLSFLEGIKTEDGSSGSSWEARSLSPDVYTSGARVDLIGRFFELASSSKGRGLIGEWIRVFVGTAVSVYLDKTKDVNIYEEIVAGVTNPSYQPAVKDLLTSVCNGAVETLVRTSHEVLSAAGSAGPSTTISPTFELGKPDTGKKVVEEGDGSSTSSSKGDAETGLSGDGCLEDTRQQKAMILVTSHGSSKISLPNWLNGLSRTLAVPSNRRLLIDVAGTVTSEAIHSFFEVFLGIVSPYLQTNLKYSRQTRRSTGTAKTADAETETTQQDSWKLVSGRAKWLENCSLLGYRDVVAKSQLIMTLSFCILLHVVDLGALEIA